MPNDPIIAAQTLKKLDALFEGVHNVCTLFQGGWCSHSNSSGESNRLRNQRGAPCPHPSPAGSGSSVLPIGSPPAPPPQTQAQMTDGDMSIQIPRLIINFA